MKLNTIALSTEHCECKVITVFLPTEPERESWNLGSNRATLKESNIADMRHSESTVSFKIDFSMLGYIYLGLAVMAQWLRMRSQA